MQRYVHGRGYRFSRQGETPATVAPISKRHRCADRTEPIMVGRQDELAQLQSWYSHAVEGQRQVIFVTGEADVGRNTFVGRSGFVTKEAGAIDAASVSNKPGRGEPYLPVIESARSLGPGTRRRVGLN